LRKANTQQVEAGKAQPSAAAQKMKELNLHMNKRILEQNAKIKTIGEELGKQKKTIFK